MTTTIDSSDQLVKVAIHHRLGEVPVGQASIVIAVSSPHRRQAFEACEYILEEVKKKAQVWKREWYAEGDGATALWKENATTCCNDHK
jgi:molybdopterin synthase catalytic subunit